MFIQAQPTLFIFVSKKIIVNGNGTHLRFKRLVRFSFKKFAGEL
jgi:hypothetical protein